MNDESESRIEALGRKRKQPFEILTNHSYAPESADKRQKLDANADFVALDDDADYGSIRRASKESGETSTSTDYGGVIVGEGIDGIEVDDEVEDLDPKGSSRFGFTSINEAARPIRTEVVHSTEGDADDVAMREAYQQSRNDGLAKTLSGISPVTAWQRAQVSKASIVDRDGNEWTSGKPSPHMFNTPPSLFSTAPDLYVKPQGERRRRKEKGPTISEATLEYTVPVRDDRDATSTSESEMRLEDLYPNEMRCHVQKHMKKRPGATVEQFLRSMVSGQHYPKHAKRFLERWYMAHAPKVVRDAHFDGRADVLTLEDMKSLLSRPQVFFRRLAFRDIRGAALRSHAKMEFKQNLGLSYDEVLLNFTKHGRFQTLARECLNQYVEMNYIGEGSSVASSDRRASRNEIEPVPRDTTSETAQQIPDFLSFEDVETELRDEQNDAVQHGHMDRMEVASANGDNDGGVDVNKQAPAELYDYGSIARSAAAAPNGEDASMHFVRLGDLTEEDQQLQHRYFCATDRRSYVRCLGCGDEGHMEDSCPASTCEHCGMVDDHSSRACVVFQKCGRCRQRGHGTVACKSLRSVPAGGLGDTCDICGQLGHVEEECSCLGRTYFPTEANVTKVARSHIRMACYNCGAASHWGDDCPTLPAFIPRTNLVWRQEYADKFIEDAEVRTTEASRALGGSQNYQMALLNDM